MQLQVFVQAYHTPSSVRQQRFNFFYIRFYHTPKHTQWVFGRATTPLCYHPPSFITPPNTPCGCSDVLSHPLVYHTPLGPSASCSLSPGVHKISHPPQDTTPGDHIFKSQNAITGVCYLVSVTVVTRAPQLVLAYLFLFFCSRESTHDRRQGLGRTPLLLALVIRPLPTHPFRDGAPLFLLLIETPPTFGRSLRLFHKTT